MHADEPMKAVLNNSCSESRPKRSLGCSFARVETTRHSNGSWLPRTKCTPTKHPQTPTAGRQKCSASKTANCHENAFLIGDLQMSLRRLFLCSCWVNDTLECTAEQPSEAADRSSLTLASSCWKKEISVSLQRKEFPESIIALVLLTAKLRIISSNHTTWSLCRNAHTESNPCRKTIVENVRKNKYESA